jgi:hypothetical protein
MKTLTKLFLTLAVLSAFAMPSLAQQNTLIQTTLAAAIPGGYLGAGVSNVNNPPPQLVQLTSVTGVVGINPNLGVTASQPNQTALYVGRELMYVIAVNGTTVTVVRGANGTVAVPHPNGAMVLVGAPRLFYTFDPGGTNNTGTGVSGVACTSTTVLVTPWVNIRTGAQWLCSSITGSWVPGFNSIAGDIIAQTATVAAAAGVILPSGPYFIISGAGAITGFTIPLGCGATAVDSCQFTVISAAGSTWTWTAAGNIMTAGTGTAGHTFIFTWSQSLLKWVPSSLT